VTKQTRGTGSCPFLETDEEGHRHDCVSHPGSPEPITPRHVDSFCRNERPFACPRFVGADPGLLRAYLRQLAYRRTANVTKDRDDKETAASAASSRLGPRIGAGQTTLDQPGVAPTAPHRQIETSRPPAPQPSSGHESIDDVGPTGNGRIPETTTVPVHDHVEIEHARVGAVREASIQGDAGGDTVPSRESEVDPIAATPRTESSLQTGIEVVPSRYAGELTTMNSLQDQLEPSPEVSLGTVHEVMPAELVSPDAQLPPVLPVKELPSHTHTPARNVAVAATPPLTAAPAMVDAQPISVGDTVPGLGSDPAETIQPLEQKLPAGVKTDEVRLDNNPADQSTIGAVVLDWPRDRETTTVHEVLSDPPSAMSRQAAAPSFSVPIKVMVRHKIPAFQNPPQATSLPQRPRRRRYIVASAVVVLLVGIGLLLRHATSSLTPHSASIHSRVPAPTTTWSFHPLKPSVDQIDFAFSNPGTTAVNVQIKAPAAKNKILKSIRISADSGEEIMLDSRAAYGALVVHASGPVVATRTSVRHGSVQYTYGNPMVRSRHP
jgi:hypothetical protein